LQDLNVLSFTKNKITEEIPPELFSLRNLSELDLSFNQITGSIPVAIEEATALEKFHVEMNSISGSIPNLSQATGLSSLKLGNNKFQGLIPSWLVDLSNLTDLLINNNQMFGTIPPEISKVSLLTTLNLSGNTLVGIIPPSVGDLVKLGKSIYVFMAYSFVGAIVLIWFFKLNMFFQYYRCFGFE
jgi:Leucine-rich repeat (LRR) protein